MSDLPGRDAAIHPTFTVSSSGGDIHVDCSVCDETFFEMPEPVDLDDLTRRVNDHCDEVHGDDD